MSRPGNSNPLQTYKSKLRTDTDKYEGRGAVQGLGKHGWTHSSSDTDTTINILSAVYCIASTQISQLDLLRKYVPRYHHKSSKTSMPKNELNKWKISCQSTCIKTERLPLVACLVGAHARWSVGSELHLPVHWCGASGWRTPPASRPPRTCPGGGTARPGSSASSSPSDCNTHTHKSRDWLHPQSSCSWRQRLTLCSTQWCLTQCKHQIAPNLVAQNFPVGTAPAIFRPSMSYFAQFCYLSTFAALCQPP